MVSAQQIGQNLKQITLLPISVIYDSDCKPIFNEFDTVGIVVQMIVNNFDQSLWLADCSGRLLFIKIFEGPKNCLLLDNLKSGQLVAASNLVFCESKLEFAEAIANHSTVISYYPQHKHLQEGMNTLNDQFPKASIFH
ncbi:BRCA-2 OB3 domain containing protein [Asbolus verrucosus]|uniref:BRCA-2 OB3 domain containing protein n=1 Tax=Asbolus verrucosus TaxID=1661398 RepID=A0A482VXR6_ASBVE|nr:BRCA-2 OB3 domain containing protein [Asbolus verrucosus]